MGSFGEFFSNIEVFIFFSRGVQSLRQRYVARFFYRAWRKERKYICSRSDEQTNRESKYINDKFEYIR